MNGVRYDFYWMLQVVIGSGFVQASLDQRQLLQNAPLRPSTTPMPSLSKKRNPMPRSALSSKSKCNPSSSAEQGLAMDGDSPFSALQGPANPTDSARPSSG